MSYLPEPTTDLNQAKANVGEFGYCMLADVLSSKTRTALLQRLQEQAEAEKTLGLAFEDGGPQQQWGAFRDASGRIRPEAFRAENGGINQRVWMLVNKGQVFVDLLNHPQINQLVQHVLGEEYLLSSHTANIAKPGGVAMDLHTDQWWMPQASRRDRKRLPVGSMTRTCFDDLDSAETGLIAPAVACNVLWMLTDFTEPNGATRVVPGSHLSGRQPDAQRDKDVATISATAPAGTALFIDGRIWHGTGANTSSDLRYAVLTSYCGPQYRPQENFTIGTCDEVLQNATPELLSLLGFKVWHAYGRTGNPTVEYVDRKEERLGVLYPDN